MVAVERLLVNRELVLGGLAEPQILGERRAVVGRIVLTRDQQDRSLLVVGADALDGRGGGQPSSDDHIFVVHGVLIPVNDSATSRGGPRPDKKRTISEESIT